MEKAVKAPQQVSLWDLIIKGYINDNEIDSKGNVKTPTRKRAETQFLHDHPQQHNNASKFRQRVPWKNGRTEVSKRSKSFSHVKRVRDIPEERNHVLCCICLAKERTHVFDPCFHLCTCENCASKIATCPLCRNEIIARHKVYL